MTIDTKRLKTDAAYWGRVSPKDATHYTPETNDNKACWWINISDDRDRALCLLAESKTDRWAMEDIHDDERAVAIPRPTKPAAPEWDGEGRPPAGVECEINLYGYWFAATVLAYGKTRFIYEISLGQVDDEGELISGEGDGFLHRAKFRPSAPRSSGKGRS